MELWLSLLFGNPVGLMSMIVVCLDLVIIGTLFLSAIKSLKLHRI
ncbi:MAG: DUF3149 domain-containing protein [Proteobacteria bacterium]|nr:DUF3149 domain-containing protein [Pseudomonadota bacterium]NOG61245.1 DUF3149 domain-containing protein [Pseudomonadota bacterium]